MSAPTAWGCLGRRRSRAVPWAGQRADHDDDHDDDDIDDDNDDDDDLDGADEDHDDDDLGDDGDHDDDGGHGHDDDADVDAGVGVGSESFRDVFQSMVKLDGYDVRLSITWIREFLKSSSLSCKNG